jgi:serine/threonine protein kinase
MDHLSEQTIKGYELRERIGAGGFGAVYRAYQPVVGREVAIKVILPQYANHPDFIRRFEAEAQLVARLEHPHIVPLYDYWREPDGAYLVMRFLHGGSLGDKIRTGGALPLEEADRLLDQITAALAVAHRHGVVHRDLKPANILLDEDGNAYLTDFGIAKSLKADADEDESEASLTGSPHYMSPEQAQQNPVSLQSDIYSLGIVLFEMLTGNTPFADTETLMEILLKQINEPLPSIQTIQSDMPEAVNLVIQRATAKNPEARYSDARSFAIAFRQAIEPAQIKTGEFAAVRPPVELTTLVVPGINNPYKGLRAFEEADSDDFFGRDHLVQHLLTQLKEKNFLAVIGPSGSGKSSVVKAGVLPALRRGALPGSDRWFLAQMVPGHDPFQELETALLSVASEQPSRLGQRLRQDETGLLKVVEEILPGSQSVLLLVIDQFEEIFTYSDDPAIRSAFLNSLLVAVTQPGCRLRVMITLRADFYDRPLLYPGFGELIRRHSEVVLPLSAEEMEQAVVGPAERAGLKVEPALVSAITAEISEQPGALPLLQYALTEIFERREGDTLTLQAYQASGGVLGALARRAEELYTQLDDQEQEAARQMFLRLVTLGGGVEDTRRRVAQAELIAVSDNQEAAQAVLDTYSKYRLFTFDNDPVTRAPTAELAHEALIREWQRLREWLNDSRDDVRIQQRLSAAAREWINQHHDPSFLAEGMRLQQFEVLIAGTNIVLTEDETGYVQASVANREALLR